MTDPRIVERTRLMLRPWPETVDDIDTDYARLDKVTLVQPLIARIKRSSKYYGQTEPGKWFDVRAVKDRGYPWRGNNNNYRTSDLAFGVRLDDGSIVELK